MSYLKRKIKQVFSLNRHKIPTRIYIFLLICLLTSVSIFSQNVKISSSELSTRALQRFNNHDYFSAADDYKELSIRFPKDVMHQYYLGVCLLESNRDLLQGLELLTMVSQKEVPDHVYFYMGKACCRLYRVEEAEKYFNQYKKLVSWQESRDINLSFELEYLSNLKIQINHLSVPRVISKTPVSSDSLIVVASVYQGTLAYKPESLKTAVDKKFNDQSIIFMPVDMKKGDYLYYSSYGNNRFKGRDIFRVKNRGDQLWSDPENLGSAINTSGDESFAYYDTQDSVLYFSSNGKNSIGGFDIFRSRYDNDKRQWATPENMCIPVNSPFDELLLLTDEKNHNVILVSDRETQPGKYYIYTLSDPSKWENSASKTASEIANLSLLEDHTNGEWIRNVPQSIQCKR